MEYSSIEQKDIDRIVKSISRIGDEVHLGCAKIRYEERWIKYFLGTTYEENLELLKRVYGER